MLRRIHCIHASAEAFNLYFRSTKNMGDSDRKKNFVGSFCWKRWLLTMWILSLFWKCKVSVYTLPETNIAIENPPFWWYLQGNMGIFTGYVSFREGRWFFRNLMVWLITWKISTFMVFAWRLDDDFPWLDPYGLKVSIFMGILPQGMPSTIPRGSVRI